jgi:hypothetical protein
MHPKNETRTPKNEKEAYPTNGKPLFKSFYKILLSNFIKRHHPLLFLSKPR